jgi:hypothetical protein
MNSVVMIMVDDVFLADIVVNALNMLVKSSEPMANDMKK